MITLMFYIAFASITTTMVIQLNISFIIGDNCKQGWVMKEKTKRMNMNTMIK